MAYEHTIRRYRSWYGYFLRLYPRPYHARFGESIEQTFSDLLRERARGERGLLGCALWMFVETSVGIIQENIMYMLTKRTFLFVLAALCLLLVPFFAMQFQVEGWDWHASDFVIMAVLLTGIGVALAAASNSAFSLQKRAIGIGSVLLILALYVHLAVGIVDTWPLAGS